MLVLVSGNHHLLRAILCTWIVRFKAVEYAKCASVDPVIIMANWEIHYKTCDPSDIQQFVYKKCADQSLGKVMVQMDIEYVVSVSCKRVTVQCNVW